MYRHHTLDAFTENTSSEDPDFANECTLTEYGQYIENLKATIRQTRRKRDRQAERIFIRQLNQADGFFGTKELALQDACARLRLVSQLGLDLTMAIRPLPDFKTARRVEHMPKGEPLKPCPFCGNQPVVWALPMLTAMGHCTTFAVRCKCGANVDTYVTDGQPIFTSGQARAVWNRRKNCIVRNLIQSLVILLQRKIGK